MPFDLDARLAEWRKALLDTTKRNRLVKFEAGRVGGVALVRPTAADLWARLVRDGEQLTFVWKRDLLGLPQEVLNAETLSADFDPANGQSALNEEAVRRELLELSLKSQRLKASDLLTDMTDRHLAARLLRLKRTSDEAQSDHGVTTLYAAFGFLKWYETNESQEEIRAPLLLVPVKLARESVEAPFTLVAEEDDILPNHCLAELLRAQFRLALPDATWLDPEDPECLPKYLDAVRAAVQKDYPRWDAVADAALGVFNFQKLAMWEDLGRNEDRVKAHALCRAIAGDSAVSLAPPADLPTAARLDELVPPAQAVHILDADSSQHEAIEAVKRGAHVVMDGPPGTGKSQTIANMIAEALSAGKTVLFVSEKTAALDVVKRRLDTCGVGDFCLELHSHKANKRDVLAELGRCLDLGRVGAPDDSAQLAALTEGRQRLNEFVAELHEVRAPLGWSAYRVHGEVAKFDAARSRVAVPDAATAPMSVLQQRCDVLARLADCKPVLDNPTDHPWRGCKLDTFAHEAKDDSRFHLDRLAKAIPAALQAVAALNEAGVATDAPSVPAWDAAVADARSLLALPLFPADWFARDPRAAAQCSIDLQRATDEARDLAAKVPEFDLAAVTKPGARVAPLDADRERLTAGTAPALRARLVAINQAAGEARQLELLGGALADAARAATGALALARVPELGRIAEVVRPGAVLARTGAGARGWWDAGRRKELLAAVTRAEAQERASQVARTDLVARFSPLAFAPESSATAREAAHAGRSLLSRLFPKWWGLRAKVVAWYAGAPASGAALRADLATLVAYHQNADAVQQVATAYGAELVKDSAGRALWSDTADALRAADALAAWGTTFDALARHDRAALGATVEAVRAAHAAFEERATAAGRAFALPGLSKQSPGEVRAWLASEVAALDREAAALESLAALLAPGKDVSGARVREAAATVARQAAVAATVRELEVGQPADAKVRAERAALGTQLLAFLDRWTRAVTPQLGAALSDKAARDRVGGAIKQSEAARGGTFASAWEHVTKVLFAPDADVSVGVTLNALPLADLARWSADRAADADRAFEWVRFVHAERAATAAGVGAVLDEVRAGEFPPEAAADAYRARFLRLWLDALHAQVPALGTFTTEGHERLVSRFADLDRAAVHGAAQRVRAGLLNTPDRPRTRDGAPDASELGVLLREVNKKRRHLPLRHLFGKIPTLLPRLKPCLMMSPLAVSTFLDSAEFAFDLVIFDEASQVRPHDAVCAIYRAKQLVVGGDPKQLPPTDFFARTGGDADEDAPDDSGTAGFESLLNVCLSLGLCRKRLRWHYRSRREGLIAFSNRHFYDGSLVTFPSADEAAARAVQLVRVEGAAFKDGVNAVEAKKVAALVMEHARATPDKSLGVIAFSQRQQDRILDELEVLRRQSKDREDFFSAERADPFFVKNLENVQGDERDHIVLSVGYGPDAAGKVMMRFGPLNRDGGERRLNVAVTRARFAMTVVSSMTAGDIDLSRTSAEGAKLLKAFLDYAERGPTALRTGVTEANERGADSPFEQEVGDELARRGLTVHRQVGCGGYRIDLAITDGQSGRYLLGVECDGASYHSAATARDRDRLRQSVLESLGWRLVRVWSTDWVRNRAAQVTKVLDALEAAKKPLPAPAKPQAPPELAPVKEPKAKVAEYESIDKVPEPAVEEALVAALTEYGSMPAEDLISAVSKKLGFKRVGPNIRDRLANALNVLVGKNQLALGDANTVRLCARP